ncbi:MAG: transporter, family, 3-phenylpropionic acid transporter [Kosmotogales bacterium]|nr:transporter, family, 3-phenylpropionic acid transporter [Kosmotogales bacterium]
MKKKSIFLESEFLFVNYSILALTAILSQFYKFRGFGDFQIGVLNAALPVMSLITNALWFKVIKKFQVKTLIALLSVFSFLTIWGIYFSDSFISELVFVSISAFFFMGILPLSELVVIRSIKSKGQDFGKVRLWGTIGFAIVSIITGFLLNIGYFMLFIVFGGVFLSIFLFNFKIKIQKHDENINIQKRENGSFRVFVLMLIFGFFLNSVNSFNMVFLPVYIMQNNYPTAVSGIAISLMGLSEIPFLFFSRRIIRRVGHINLLFISLFTMSVRILLTPLVGSFLLLIALQLLHGGTFIVMYFTIQNYIHYNLSEKDTNKGQMLLWMTLQGFSFFAGSFFGGILTEKITIAGSYYLLGFSSLLISAVLLLIIIVRKKFLSKT